MSYNVKTAEFEGPFQLLLHLVSQRKVDIGNISISEVAEQFLAYLDNVRSLDMDVASDFVEVAASLLAIKAASLLPDASDYEVDEEFEGLEPEDAREILISRLIAYKQFKNAAAALGTRMENEGRMHARQAGLEQPFLGVLPDYLEGVNLENLALICASLAARREEFLLEARHIAARPIPVESRLEEMCTRLARRRSLTFSDLLEGRRDSVFVVVSFLAMLELFHRGMVEIAQTELYGEITLNWIEEKDWAPAEPEAADEPDPVDEYLAGIESNNESELDNDTELDNDNELDSDTATTDNATTDTATTGVPHD